MSETVTNLINAIASGDALETENAFNAAMAEKISAKLDDMKVEVAKGMFAGSSTDEIAPSDSADATVETSTEETTEE